MAKAEGEAKDMAAGGLNRRVTAYLPTHMDDQYLWGYRTVAFALGPLFMALIPLRLLFLKPWTVAYQSSWEAGITGALLILFALLAPRLRRLLPGTEDLALLFCLICLVNNVALMAILKEHHQSMNFLMLQVGISTGFRRLWRFLVSQVACFGAWIISYLWLLGFDQFMPWLFGMLVTAMVALGIFLFLNRLIDELERLRSQDQGLIEVRDQLITELEAALESVKTLNGLIPICAHCKKIRNDKGYWQQVETYVSQHTEAEFTHGLCPDCADNLKSEFEKLHPGEGQQG
jgi:hypothetical protein